MEEQDTLERIFRTRGYKVVRSSRDNRYLLLKKSGSAMAVGYSVSSRKTTEGEAEMFISMGQNDSAESMLFISPVKLSRSVKNTFEKEGVATWDRMALSIAIGEQVLSEWSTIDDDETQSRSVMDLFDTDDVDPLKDVRAYHKEINSKEVGGFKVREVEVGSVKKPVDNLDTVSDGTLEFSLPPQEPVPEVNKESPTPPPATEFDLPMMPMVDLSTEEQTTKNKVEGEKGTHKVPEDILLDPWAGFEDREISEGTTGIKKPSTRSRTNKPSGWEGATMAPVKYSQSDAVSLAGDKGNIKLKRTNQPFLILEASYIMIPEDDSEPVEEDGTYIYDCTRSDVIDIPGTLYDEIAAMDERWDGKEGPEKLTDPKEDHNSAITAIRDRIKSGRLAKDRKVRETLMSTIYREIDYKFDPSSLKLISSRRVMLPFWEKKGKKGKKDWSVNAFLGQLVK